MTIAGNFAPAPPAPPGLTRERWELDDGDFLDVDRAAAEPSPDRASRERALVVICHGLEGSSEAGYVRGLQVALLRLGLDTVALNFRGCSGELNRGRCLYHSGETSDLERVIERLRAERPGLALGLAGFSLGGNVVAKYLGERGGDVPREVACAVAISAPLDLAACARTIDGPGLLLWIYRERFLRRLREKARAKAAQYPSAFDLRAALAARTIWGFDDTVTAPLHGFASAEDYYRRSSAGPLLGAVARPLHLIHADDDPMVPGRTLPLAEIESNPLVSLDRTETGGHVAFLTGAPWRPARWAERRAADFLSRHLGGDAGIRTARRTGSIDD